MELPLYQEYKWYFKTVYIWFAGVPDVDDDQEEDTPDDVQKCK